MRLGDALCARGRFHAAVRCFERAQEIAPHASVRDRLERTRRKAHEQDLRGGPEGGVRDLREMDEWLDMFHCLPDPRQRLALLALCWNALSQEDRLRVLRLLISTIGGAVLPELELEAKDMHSLPMDNYIDILDSIPEPWMEWVRSHPWETQEQVRGGWQLMRSSHSPPAPSHFLSTGAAISARVGRLELRGARAGRPRHAGVLWWRRRCWWTVPSRDSGKSG